jgi:hypothetical protein
MGRGREKETRLQIFCKIHMNVVKIKGKVFPVTGREDP